MRRISPARSLCTWTLAASLIGSAVIGPIANADEPPARVQWRKTEPLPTAWSTATTAPTPTPSPVASLTQDNLATLLRDLGYTPKVIRLDAGVIYELSLRQGPATLPVQVSLSPSGQYLWLTLIVKSDLPSYDSIPSKTLARLLEANEEIGPTHFAIIKATNQLCLKCPVPARTVTGASLKTSLDAFVARVISTEPLWGNK